MENGQNKFTSLKKGFNEVLGQKSKNGGISMLTNFDKDSWNCKNLWNLFCKPGGDFQITAIWPRMLQRPYSFLKSLIITKYKKSKQINVTLQFEKND